MSRFWIEETTYRVVIEVAGHEQVHEATLEDDHSPWPESSASCSCGFSYGPRRRGARDALLGHFGELGASDVRPAGTKRKPI